MGGWLGKDHHPHYRRHPYNGIMGALPVQCHAMIQEDANPWILERLSGSMIYRNFRPDVTRIAVPLKIVSLQQRQPIALAITQDRFIIAVWGGRQQLHIPFVDYNRWTSITIDVGHPDDDNNNNNNHAMGPTTTRTRTTTPQPSTLIVIADAQLWNPQYRGIIEIRCETEHAVELSRRIHTGRLWYEEHRMVVTHVPSRRRTGTNDNYDDDGGDTMRSEDDHDDDNDDDSHVDDEKRDERRRTRRRPMISPTSVLRTG